MHDPQPASQQRLQLGQHIVSIAESADTRLGLVASAFRYALSQECRCIYVGDRIGARALSDHLTRQGCDVSRASARGQFQCLAPNEVYTRGGHFDVERVLDDLCDSIDKARRDGFAGLYAAGDAAWIWQGIPGVDRFLEYEYRVNLVEDRDSVLLVCLYDGRRTSSWFESELLKCHPFFHDGGQVADSPDFIPGPVELADVPLLEDLEPPADSLPCQLISELLSAYVDGELLERRREEVARHLTACRRCLSVVEAYRELKRAASTARVRPPVPDGLWDTVRSQFGKDSTHN
jgi:hypothetical protein